MIFASFNPNGDMKYLGEFLEKIVLGFYVLVAVVVAWAAIAWARRRAARRRKQEEEHSPAP